MADDNLFDQVRANTKQIEDLSRFVKGDPLWPMIPGLLALLQQLQAEQASLRWRMMLLSWVVTLAEEIGGEDARTLTLHFWTGIGRGLEPGVALATALERCSPVVSEFVVRHW